MQKQSVRAEISVVAIAPVLVMLVGCGAESEEPPAPPAFHFASGDLVISEFHSDVVGEHLFDPCTEISKEEYAAAGIHGVEPLETEFGDDSVVISCTSNDPGASSTRRIHASVLSENSVKASGGSHVDHPESSVPGLYTVTEGSGECTAQVDTERGALAIGRWKADLQGNEDVTCREAQKEMEKLYEAVSGNGE